MAAYNKFLDFVEQLGLGKHNLDADFIGLALSNTGPVNTNTILANITQIANGNGYTTAGAGAGADAQASWAESPAGTGTLTGTKYTWTSSGAGMAQFRYVVLFNDTQTSPVDPLIAWWDYGSGLTLAVGETFTVKFNSGDPTGTILTLT